jgi:folate-binding protein YgfZ
MMGREITDKTIPAELGPAIIDRAVSFTKGCFTGQELVARIESRGGHVPRLLRRLVCDRALAPGDVLRTGGDDGKVVGTVTSAAIGDDGTTVALGFVGRDVVPPATVTAGGATVELRATDIA